jgi:hypothetical protein
VHIRGILLILLVFSSYSSFAKGPFGDVTKKTFSTGGDQSRCTAERLLENAVEATGIDFVDGSVRQIWNCKNGEGPATASARRCPYDQNMKSQTYKCYSNTSSGFPYICISGTRSEEVEEIYAGDKSPRKIPRARFSQAFIFQSDQNVKNIQMDADGCEATEVTGWDSTGFFNNGSTYSDKEECIKRLKASLEGGYIDPPEAATKYSPARPGIKHCDASKAKDDRQISAHLTATKELFHCYEAFPNLDRLLKASYSKPATKSNSTKKERAVR